MTSSPAHRRVYLTRSLLPPIDEVNRLLAEVWKSGILSNGGPLEARFETSLGRALGWRNVSLVSSGTMALQLLSRACDLDGDVLIPALTHPATYQALRWNGLRPVPVDVDRETLTMDPDLAAAAVTDRTCAILAVHLFGHPADVIGLDRLAAARKLVLLYDAAAATGVRYRSEPLANFGDGCAVSLHSTKILGTGEGGAVITRDESLHDKVRVLRNFGLRTGAAPLEYGTNGKLSEVASAIGVAALPYLLREIRGREIAIQRYRERLREADGVEFVDARAGTQSNYSYAALRLRTSSGEPAAEQVQKVLDAHGIDSRRYFGAGYRLVRDERCHTPIADAACEDLLCVPLWGTMPEELIAEICGHIMTQCR